MANVKLVTLTVDSNMTWSWYDELLDFGFVMADVEFFSLRLDILKYLLSFWHSVKEPTSPNDSTLRGSMVILVEDKRKKFNILLNWRNKNDYHQNVWTSAKALSFCTRFSSLQWPQYWRLEELREPFLQIAICYCLSLEHRQNLKLFEILITYRF